MLIFFTIFPSESNPSKTISERSSEILPLIVSVMALGCSIISLSMKCLYPPFSAMRGFHVTLLGSLAMPFPSKSRTSTSPSERTAISPSSRKMKSRV